MHMQQPGNEQGKRNVRGRKRNGQDEIANITEIRDREDDLVELYKAKEAATLELQEAIKAAAEKANLNASNVARYIAKKANDKLDEARRDITQLALLFDVA